MKNKKVGIVLEENYTRIISSISGKVYDNSSVVCWNNLTKEIVLVGKDVENAIGRLDDPLVVVRLLKNYAVQDFEIFKAYLKILVEDFFNVFKNAEVIVSSPSSDLEFIRNFIYNILKVEGGASSVEFVSKTLLSAIGSNANVNDEYGVLILDIGYSCSKVALIINGKIEKSGVTIAGEKELDDMIIQFIKEQYQLVINDETVEKIKWSIGTIIKLRDELELSIFGRDLITNDRRVIVCASAEIKKLFIRLFTNYKTLITNVLESSSPIIRSSVIKNGLFVSGDLAGIIGVKDFFEDFFNFPVTISKKKGYSAIEGAIKYNK
ncbi:rod shape-determining protein [Mesoplasma corruscae]|uniref:Cell shape determining protein MreB n=1 Tax=Mesoplasma corruscae TaxID=216874 RepID=A0A2S5RH97_9MOLU|nr:rod shape-determining protein [Mesoplasma corruscae]PPE06671.1 cell shape determining protein MreB [Mesoplasma corruscae]